MTVDEFLSWQAVGKLVVLIVVIAFAVAAAKDNL